MIEEKPNLKLYMLVLATLFLLTMIFVVFAHGEKLACKPGQYLTVDGRCLHDRTGEVMPAGDHCNSVVCLDANCRQTVVTAVYCGQPDDPAVDDASDGAWVSDMRVEPGAYYRRAKNGDALNDLKMTPGALLKQDTKAVLCSKAFRTATVRHVTESTKQAVCAAYGVPRANCTGSNYEVDHLISLELGSSDEISNLWPQPYPSARAKDLVEDSLHRDVCAGKIALTTAQHCIATDWTKCETAK